jgi:large subunit ribosomal protein L18
MKTKNEKTEKRNRRHARIRAKVFGTGNRPRLSVFKSNKNISAQIIDDDKNMTIVSARSGEVKDGKMTDKAKAVGLMLASKAKGKKIEKVVFDRGGFAYSGVIKALADGAREGGLQF